MLPGIVCEQPHIFEVVPNRVSGANYPPFRRAQKYGHLIAKRVR